MQLFGLKEDTGPVPRSPTGWTFGVYGLSSGGGRLLRTTARRATLPNFQDTRGTPSGVTLADLIDDLNPVVVGWRNYYRYATRAWREFAKHDWWLYRRVESWLGKKHGKASGRKLRRIYPKPGGKRSGWRMRGRELARFADAKRLLFPDRGLRIPNGWNATPDEHFRKGADKFWEATRALASL